MCPIPTSSPLNPQVERPHFLAGFSAGHSKNILAYFALKRDLENELNDWQGVSKGFSKLLVIVWFSNSPFLPAVPWAWQPLNQETLYQAGRILRLMIPSDCLNSTWRLAKENPVLVFQWSWQFILLPYRAEIYASSKSPFMRGSGSTQEQSAEAPGSVDSIQI